ncbi:hypothetical protein JCM19238_2427 [Vibrio ponticus]|nr:hypothetical protein JCM19238_2427 [Vibrio ponticus]
MLANFISGLFDLVPNLLMWKKISSNKQINKLVKVNHNRNK